MTRGTPSTSESAEVRHAVVRYLLYGAVALVVVSVPTFVVFGRIAEAHALESAGEDGASIVGRLLAPAVTDELIASRPEAVAAMDRRLVSRMSDGSLRQGQDLDSRRDRGLLGRARTHRAVLPSQPRPDQGESRWLPR